MNINPELTVSAEGKPLHMGLLYSAENKQYVSHLRKVYTESLEEIVPEGYYVEDGKMNWPVSYGTYAFTLMDDVTHYVMKDAYGENIGYVLNVKGISPEVLEYYRFP